MRGAEARMAAGLREPSPGGVTRLRHLPPGRRDGAPAGAFRRARRGAVLPRGATGAG